MRLLLFPHNGCDNHGCEAIARSTAKLLDVNKNDLHLYTANIDSDLYFGMNQIYSLLPNRSSSVNIGIFRKYLFALSEKMFNKDRDLEELSYKHKNILKYKNNSIALSIGGDNYCYRGMKHVLSEHMKLFKHNNIDCILWGCSLEEKYLDSRTINELNDYKLIIARESLSYDLLQKNNINTKIEICPDSAFILSMEKIVKYDYYFDKSDVIGINVSGLIYNYDSYEDATFNNFANLIDYILKNTRNKIVLIPHVRKKGLDDLDTCYKLLNRFNDSRVICIDDNCNCMQLKYLISKCKAFVACRTHASIAAYSTCVPTLVVGYSTKSKGICKDIFGSYEDLVLDAREFKSDDDLTNAFIKFEDKYDYYKETLEKVMPVYINRCYDAKKYLDEFIANRNKK